MQKLWWWSFFYLTSPESIYSRFCWFCKSSCRACRKEAEYYCNTNDNMFSIWSMHVASIFFLMTNQYYNIYMSTEYYRSSLLIIMMLNTNLYFPPLYITIIYISPPILGLFLTNLHQLLLLASVECSLPFKSPFAITTCILANLIFWDIPTYWVKMYSTYLLPIYVYMTFTFIGLYQAMPGKYRMLPHIYLFYGWLIKEQIIQY